MTEWPPRPVSRALVSPADLAPGAAFMVPALEAGPSAWWHVDRLVPLAWDDGTGPRVRVILQERDHRGRPYRVTLFRADAVVWASTLAPATLAAPRLGHQVDCTTRGCPRGWGYLPVSASSAPCFPCAEARVMGI